MISFLYKFSFSYLKKLFCPIWKDKNAQNSSKLCNLITRYVLYYLLLQQIRAIEQEALFGGKPCPSKLAQNITCNNFKCVKTDCQVSEFLEFQECLVPLEGFNR